MSTPASKQKGFTIVELLIVIVVIGILAAITIVAYNGVTQRAQEAKISSDVANLVKAVIAARTTTGKTLNGITGSYGTAGSCAAKASGTDLGTLAKTDSCWTDYLRALSLITDAGGVNVNNLVDPWGRPYLIDENEGEGGFCYLDSIGAYTHPFTGGYSFYPTSPPGKVPLSYNGICP
jgi:prepilin-type N-terminal cleavage/methylation domain-containing protein